VESVNPEDYQWSFIKGESGVNRQIGYTWIRYSDYADGTGLYQRPMENARYIGIAVNKTTPEESTTSP
jgi:hypothetical protein